MINSIQSTQNHSVQSSNSTDGSNNKNIKIGTYELLGTIGHGNFSVCKLALNKLSNNKVAIKCIEKKSLDESHLKRIYKEIDIMKSLDHKHIIKLYQVMESKSMLYLVCEYALNGEIFDYILKNGAMSEKMACEKFSQIISAVEYCHNKNIVHRDLKSENLLLDHNMNIKLADFGFANYFDLVNPLKTFCGSPPYAAPEIFCGKKYFGPEIDIWSMGVILYVLVTASLPFDSDNLQLLKQRVLSCKYNVPYFVSLDCQNLISHMLELNTAKRYKLQQIKSHRWIKLNGLNSYYVFSQMKSTDSSKKQSDMLIVNAVESFNKIQSKSMKSLIKKSDMTQAQKNNNSNSSNNNDRNNNDTRNLTRLSTLSLPLYTSFEDSPSEEQQQQQQTTTSNTLDEPANNINKTGSYYQIKENNEKPDKKMLFNPVYHHKSTSTKSHVNSNNDSKTNNKYSNIFKNFDIFSNLVSNYSSSLDESGVESDLSSQTSSSFSSDLFSSSVASCYSINNTSSAPNSSTSHRVARYRLDHGSTSSSTSSSLSNNTNNNKKHSLPASLAQSRKNKLKNMSNKTKNVNDLTQIKHELNSLIKKNQVSLSSTPTSNSATNQSGLFANLLLKHNNNNNNKNIKEEDMGQTLDNAQDSNHQHNNNNNNAKQGRLLFSRLSGKSKKNDDTILNKSESHAPAQSSHHQNKLARFFGFKKAMKEKSCSLNSLTNSIDNLKLEKVVYKNDENVDKIEQNIINDDINNQTNSSNNSNKMNNYFDHFKLTSSYSRFKFYRKYSLKN